MTAIITKTVKTPSAAAIIYPATSAVVVAGWEFSNNNDLFTQHMRDLMEAEGETVTRTGFYLGYTAHRLAKSGQGLTQALVDRVAKALAGSKGAQGSALDEDVKRAYGAARTQWSRNREAWGGEVKAEKTKPGSQAGKVKAKPEAATKGEAKPPKLATAKIETADLKAATVLRAFREEAASMHMLLSKAAKVAPADPTLVEMGKALEALRLTLATLK